MANRRMFSRAITGSARFLKLSAQARALYFDLGMEADDDGFVEAFVRLRVTGAEEAHLRELETAGFLKVLNEDLVVHLRDWTVNNLIRRDRYTPSVYRALCPECVQEPQPPEAGKESAPRTEQQAEPRVDSQTEPPMEPRMESRMETVGQPKGSFLGDSRLTQVRLGKDSVGKDRLGKDSVGKGSVGQESAGARARERPWERPEKAGENQTRQVEKVWDSMYFPVNSKPFPDSHSPPQKPPPV